MPTWVKVAIDAWTSAAGLAEGHVFPPVNRDDKVQGEAISEKVVWQMLQQYAIDAGVPGIAPHDCRRSSAERRDQAAGVSIAPSAKRVRHAALLVSILGCCRHPWDETKRPMSSAQSCRVR